MKFYVLLSLVVITTAYELQSFVEYKRFANENNYKSVSEYANERGFKNFDQEFNLFKQKYNKQYISSEELEERKFNFLKSLIFIAAHNEKYVHGQVSSYVGVNQFADLSDEEYKTPDITPPLKPSSERGINENVNFVAPNVDPLPHCFDWRNKSKVTPVKDQGKCGACWAFAGNAAIESIYAIKHNEFISFSEQQLIDCTYGPEDEDNKGCEGGSPGTSFAYLKTHGLEKESDYPYIANRSTCNENSESFNVKLAIFRQFGKIYFGDPPATDTDIMAGVHVYGPGAVGINSQGDDFKHYKGGVITSNNDGVTHVVTIVGWCTENDQDYWIIKNSWGEQWGEGGFGKILRGHDLRNINEYIYFPEI